MQAAQQELKSRSSSKSSRGGEEDGLGWKRYFERVSELLSLADIPPPSVGGLLAPAAAGKLEGLTG